MTTWWTDGYPASESLWRRLVGVLGRREMGLASGSDVVEWATDALAGGRDSPSLRVLAGLMSPTNEFEVDTHLRGAAAELGWNLPGGDGLLRLYAMVVADDIAGGRMIAQDGARVLYHIFQAANALPELAVWTGLDDAVSLARDGIYGDMRDVEKEIVRQAQRLLEKPR